MPSTLEAILRSLPRSEFNQAAMTVSTAFPDQKALASNAVSSDLKTFYNSFQCHATQISLEMFKDAWTRADLDLLHYCLTVPELGNLALSLFISHNPSLEASSLASTFLFYTLYQVYFTQREELKEGFRFGLERLSLLAALRDEAEGAQEKSDTVTAFDRLWSCGAFSCIVYERLSSKTLTAPTLFTAPVASLIPQHQDANIIERLVYILRHLTGPDSTPSACSFESLKKLRSTVLKYRVATGCDAEDRIVQLLAEIEKAIKGQYLQAANKPTMQQTASGAHGSRRPTRQDIRARLGREKLMAIGSVSPPGQNDGMVIDWATGTVINKRSASVPPLNAHATLKRRKASRPEHTDVHLQQLHLPSQLQFQFQMQAQTESHLQPQETEHFVLEDMPRLEF
jgi:hypothetical protein